MIEYKKGDLLSGGTEAIVNAVNCVGVMGRGIALQFKKQFPDSFKYYEVACKCGGVVPGEMLVYETGSFAMPRYIINFPTKRHWRSISRLEDIKSGLSDLACVIHDYGITSIAIPALGCGLGGLDWNEVKLCIEESMGSLADVQIEIYEPR